MDFLLLEVNLLVEVNGPDGAAFADHDLETRADLDGRDRRVVTSISHRIPDRIRRSLEHGRRAGDRLDLLPASAAKTELSPPARRARRQTVVQGLGQFFGGELVCNPGDARQALAGVFPAAVINMLLPGAGTTGMVPFRRRMEPLCFWTKRVACRSPCECLGMDSSM